MAPPATAPLASLGDRLLRSASLRRAVARATRRRGLVLLVHRVSSEGPAPHEVVPTVPTALLRRQLEALSTVGEIVPLGDLDDPAERRRPRFALTFDDDHKGHTTHSLPLLRELGLPGTFFLSGRWEHGLGRYWWEVLEGMVRDGGVEAVAARLGHHDAIRPQCLAARIEDTPIADDLARFDTSTAAGDRMDGDDARALLAAGMTVGFHTVEHRVMTSLDHTEVVRAITFGRTELEKCLGTAVDGFAYPHGRAGRREADAVAAHGFIGAWTTAHRPVTPATDPYLRGRWEPGLAEPEEVVRGALMRLALPPVGAGRR